MTDRYFLTPERHEELQKELAELKTKGREEISSLLKKSKELGDLSENFEYQEARDEKNRLEQRISQLEDILRNYVFIKRDKKTTIVQIGSSVTLKKDKNVVNYIIVGSNEADPAKGFISNESPAGRAVLGAKAGDSVKVKTPKGEITYQILDIN